MDEEIIILEDESEVIEEIEVTEGFGYSVGGTSVRHSNLGDRYDTDQHLITSITGLRAELDEIEKLKTVCSDTRGQADYYLWGEEATESNPLGPGYFVRLSEDGMIYKCTNETIDMLGVTISSAGFIGNDENIVDTHTSTKATDINYALVATSGVVDVLCGHDVIVGHYVYPTAGGWAKKSDGSYGYLVTDIIIDGELTYARITLTSSVRHAKNISEEVKELRNDVDRIDQNTTTLSNTAEAYIKVAEEAAKQAQESAEASSVNSQNASAAAQGAQQSATNAWNSVQPLLDAAQQAVEDARIAQEAATTIKSDAILEANKAAAQTAQGVVEPVKAVQYRLDRYTIGQYSQAYGLTFEQAKAMIPEGYVFIPMDEDPSENAGYEVKEVYAKEDGDISQVFSDIYSYKWTENGWVLEHGVPGGNVSYSRICLEKDDGHYWFVPKEYITIVDKWVKPITEGAELLVYYANDTEQYYIYNGTTWEAKDEPPYSCGLLYRRENGVWVKKAVHKENVMSRTIAHLYQDNDTIRQSVNTVDGKVAAVETKVTETDARVGLVASVPTGIQAVPGNYNAETETIDIIVDKTALDTNWLDKATVGKYYVVGSKLPYTVYECIEDASTKSKSFEPKDTVTYDGVNFYKINIASIITSANEDSSDIQLNAQKIQFNGEGIFHDENGITRINGSAITTGTISANVMSAAEIIGAINETGDDTELKIRADKIVVDGADISLASKNINLTSDNITISSNRFNVDSTGNVEASNMTLTGGEIKSSNYIVSELTIWEAQEQPLYSEGLAYTLSDDGTYYTVSGIGSCADVEIAIPPQYNGIGVTSIGDFAFQYCTNLTSITIPNSVEVLGIAAFWYCTNLTSVTIGNSVTSIGHHAFQYCSSLTSVNMPNSITNIGSSAFEYCDSLTSVNMPNSITNIGSYAFNGCSSLTEVIIPNSVTSIGDSVFSGCIYLTEVMIGNSVTSIDARAFAYCDNLTSVYYKGTQNQWASINIKEDGNSSLINATIYYYSEEQPMNAGNYWHYNDQGSFINLADGSFDSKNFKIDSNGNVTASNMVLTDGRIDTPNFKLNADGTITAMNANISGHINADSGDIGSFTIVEDGLVSPQITIRPDLVHFTSQAELKLGNYVTLADSDKKTYISTTGDKDFEIRNSDGGGLLFKANSEEQSVYKTLYINNIEITRKWGQSGNTGSYAYYFSFTATAGINDAEVFTENKTISFSIKYPTLSWGVYKDTFKTVTFVFPKGTHTQHFSVHINTFEHGPDINSYYGWQILEPIKSEGYGFTSSYEKSYLIGNGTNDVVYSLGSFLPVKNNLFLGDADNPWGTLVVESFTQTGSDKKIKKDIGSLEENYELMFDKLSPVRFKYIDGTSDRYHVGFIAQDVEFAVQDSKMTNLDFAGLCISDLKNKEEASYTLRYEEFVALNTWQIQKLKARITEQDKLISDLTSRLTVLEEKLK